MPTPKGWGGFSAGTQATDRASMQSLYRSALAQRRTSSASSSDPEWLPPPAGRLAFRRAGGLACPVNLSGAPVPLPGGRVLLASADVVGGTLLSDSAVRLQA